MGDLEPKINITATALRVTAKALLGSVPVAGPLIAAVIDEVMPALRVYRLESFAGELGARLHDVPGDVLRLRIEEPGRFDLLEDGLWQAARTSSHERHGHIANVVANGLKAEDAEELDRRHILRLFGEINDVEVLLLAGHAIESDQLRQQFWEKHASAVRYKPPTFGSEQRVIEKATIHDDYAAHLLRLDLLEEDVHVRDERPIKFERDGTVQGWRTQRVSGTGRLLLREIGVDAQVY